MPMSVTSPRSVMVEPPQPPMPPWRFSAKQRERTIFDRQNHNKLVGGDWNMVWLIFPLIISKKHKNTLEVWIVWKMAFIFPLILGMSSSQLTNSLHHFSEGWLNHQKFRWNLGSRLAGTIHCGSFFRGLQRAVTIAYDLNTYIYNHIYIYTPIHIYIYIHININTNINIHGTGYNMHPYDEPSIDGFRSFFWRKPCCLEWRTGPHGVAQDSWWSWPWGMELANKTA